MSTEELDIGTINRLGQEMDNTFAEKLGVDLQKSKVPAMLGATLGQADAEGIPVEQIKEAIDFLYEPDQRETVRLLREMLKRQGG